MPSYLSLLSVTDVQASFAHCIRDKRKQLKLSREDLAAKSSVPASTIKKFELTGQISLRQFLLLWQSLDRLDRIEAICKPKMFVPKSIDEVLRQ
jgi:transcriptional regulator with XRE-family HTH domain